MQKGRDTEFIIPIKGIAIGKHNYEFTIGSSFFEEFSNSQIISAELVANVELEKAATLIKLRCNIKGKVGVECDICLEEVKIPTDTDASMLVKFTRTEQEEEDDEVMILEPSEAELDLKQFFYDYICLSLPLKRVHEIGECDPIMIEKLNSIKIY